MVKEIFHATREFLFPIGDVLYGIHMMNKHKIPIPDTYRCKPNLCNKVASKELTLFIINIATYAVADDDIEKLQDPEYLELYVKLTSHDNEFFFILPEILLATLMNDYNISDNDIIKFMTRVKIPDTWRLAKYIRRIDIDNLEDGDLIMGLRQLSDMLVSTVYKVDSFRDPNTLVGDVLFYGIYKGGYIEDVTPIPR